MRPAAEVGARERVVSIHVTDQLTSSLISFKDHGSPFDLGANDGTAIPMVLSLSRWEKENYPVCASETTG